MKIISGWIILTLGFIVTWLLSGCVLPAQRSDAPVPLDARYAAWQRTLTPVHKATDTPGSAQPITEPETELNAEDSIRIFLHPGLSDALKTTLDIPDAHITDDEQAANVRVKLGKPNPDQASLPGATRWVYALVAPFYTITDAITSSELAAIWRSDNSGNPAFDEILVTADVYAVLLELFGPPDDSTVTLVTKDALNQRALTDQRFLSLLPFEELIPQWKLLRVDGQSPIDDVFSLETYPLTVEVWTEGEQEALMDKLPMSNYDPNKRTILLTTGVTALTRATAHRMELHGNTYPGQDIQAWFSAADLVHISNEIPFAENCPYPNPVQADLIFCSSPDRIELLEYASADIIELSGNHMLDYGVSPMNLTLEMYAERGWETFAGGWDLADAQSPALISHNGNQLAFIGCNPVGLPNAWATDTQPGATPCGDYQWMLAEIRSLRNEGYLPIVTLQYFEDYTPYPSARMEADFQQLAEAGAIMVSGSQAHTPKTMVFYDGSFLHYGLGNLFFDQMEVYYNGVFMPNTREAFIDRLVFYDGQLVSVELLTTLLEDYARPRPMTSIERNNLLTRIFELAVETDE